MPSINLITSRPTLRFGDERWFAKGWQLSFDLAIRNRYLEEVELTTPERFDELEGRLYLQSDEAEAQEGHEKGIIYFSKAMQGSDYSREASYSVTLRLPPNELASAVSNIVAGFPLSSISVDSEQLDYGWAPDGSMSKWDNEAKPLLPVDGFSLYFGHPDRDLDDEATKIDDPKEVRNWQLGQIEGVRGSIAALAAKSSNTNTLLILIFVALCVLIGRAP